MHPEGYKTAATIGTGISSHVRLMKSRASVKGRQVHKYRYNGKHKLAYKARFYKAKCPNDLLVILWRDMLLYFLLDPHLHSFPSILHFSPCTRLPTAGIRRVLIPASVCRHLEASGLDTDLASVLLT